MMDEFENRSRHRQPSESDAATSEEPDDGDPDLPEQEDATPDPPEGSGPQDQYFEVGLPFSVRSLQVNPADQRARSSSGRRARTVSGSSSGRYVGAAVPAGKASDLALDAILRAAAPHQRERRAGEVDHLEDERAPALLIEP